MKIIPAQVPLSVIIPFFLAISDRSWTRFKENEAIFVSTYGVEIWQDVFNFQVKPALDKNSDRWLLNQWLG